MLTHLEICNSEVTHIQVTERLQNPGHGGQSFFFGVVRNRNHGRVVKAVTYDCHPELSRSVLETIILECRSQFGENLDAVVIHATNRIEPGGISVAIGVSTPHRDEAFLACRYIIEQIKVRLPVWKQEHYEDGDSEWLKGHELCQHGNRKQEDHK